MFMTQFYTILSCELFLAQNSQVLRKLAPKCCRRGSSLVFKIKIGPWSSHGFWAKKKFPPDISKGPPGFGGFWDILTLDMNISNYNNIYIYTYIYIYTLKIRTLEKCRFPLETRSLPGKPGVSGKTRVSTSRIFLKKRLNSEAPNT